MYIRADAELTAAGKARAASLSTGATLCGLSAAAVLGTKWLDASAPAEIVRTERQAQRGMVVHSYRLADDEVCSVWGMRLTTPARTAFDIGRRLPTPAAVPVLDALFNATGLKPADVTAVAEWQVAVEYDGIQHWADRYQRSWDIERIALLEAAGWAVIRVSAEMLSRRPEVIVERVTAKLAERGAYGRNAGRCAT